MKNKPGKLYGMAKAHKDNVSLRPVISIIDNPEYKPCKIFGLNY